MAIQIMQNNPNKREFRSVSNEIWIPASSQLLIFRNNHSIAKYFAYKLYFRNDHLVERRHDKEPVEKFNSQKE